MWIGTEDHKVVGRALEVARKAAGTTQQELAEQLGKPQSFISAYESGQRRIDLLEFLLIAAALTADPHKVFADVIERDNGIIKRILRSRRQKPIS